MNDAAIILGLQAENARLKADNDRLRARIAELLSEAAKATQPTPPAEPAALEAAVLALLEDRKIASLTGQDERFWRCHYRAVARQCAHGKSLDGPCEACGATGVGK